MTPEPISNKDISSLLFDQGLTIEKLKLKIARLEKLVILAIVTNLPQLLEILKP